MPENNSYLSSSAANRRPAIITIICILGFAGVALSSFGYLIPVSRELLIQKYGVLGSSISAISLIFILASLIGYWQMRKWGVYIYSIGFVIGVAYSIFIGEYYILSYIIPLAVIIAGFANFRKMS